MTCISDDESDYEFDDEFVDAYDMTSNITSKQKIVRHHDWSARDKKDFYGIVFFWKICRCPVQFLQFSAF